MSIGFDSPRTLAIALCVAVLAGVVAVVRRVDIPRGALVFIAIGLVLIALAAGGAWVDWRVERSVTVMVDLSPSTRGAAYRDRGMLEHRIAQLVGNTPHRTIFFSDENHPDDAGSAASVLMDLPSDRTNFAPPTDAAAVLLFSDARFSRASDSTLPPPTFVVIDPLLESPPDARVAQLTLRGDSLVAEIANADAPRKLTWDGVDASTQPVDRGEFTIVHQLKAGASIARAALSTGDAWPENDALTLRPPSPTRAARWYVGASSATPPDASWRALSPSDLSTDPADYLAPAVIVLDNIAASDLTSSQRERLDQYIRDLGGGVVIVGGNRAFAAGDYQGTILDAISPLASTPPRATTRWVLLVDSSGSMSASGDVAGDPRTRWQFATDAMVQALRGLPQKDFLAIGSFADSVRWWASGKTVRETSDTSFPPSDITPRGPTNLAAALKETATAVDAAMPTQLLVLTDAEANIDDADAIAASLKSKNVRVHVLVTGSQTNAALDRIAKATGGMVLKQSNPRDWAKSVERLTRDVAPKWLNDSAIEVRFSEKTGLAARKISPPWNRTWLKTSDSLAEARDGNETIAMAARWQQGSGAVAAMAFRATPSEIAAIANLVASPPKDPRFNVTWEPGSRLHVVVDATSGGGYLNGQLISLELANASSLTPLKAVALEQTAPGRYEQTIGAPREPSFATLRHQDRVIDRIALAGRYAQEFDAIGNDRAAMRELAQSTGGEVIEPPRTSPIDFHWPPRRVPLLAPLAVAGAIFVAFGLILWRRG